ncbi:MAG: Membrane protein insertase, YidC/Oxa1 family [Parcubacteria group bacterium GW2011_GWC1_43_12]|nr:MAG: Membrane protein insertase, YidC/Oxa1 family [Parcubacteria group bacterium GW2011_GWB1_42_6]KKS91743.1 MAG: Membrane protein insertase, YidC/Oxa1 family [Parcubacteria group bacterium GW2011_GWC1_43_12]
MIGDLFNSIFYQPLFNGLIFLYNTIAFESFGVAVILLTLVIRFALYPLNKKAIESQKALNVLQPKIKEIQAKFKNDRVKQSEELMKIYQEHKINPASGCLPILIQLPILIGLYQVFFRGLDPASLDALYSFVSRPEAINPWFFGLVDLSKNNALMAILAGALTFVQSKMMMPKQTASSGPGDFAAAMQKQMLYMMPIITIFITWKLPSGLALYWIVTTLFSIFQQYITLRTNKKNEKKSLAG